MQSFHSFVDRKKRKTVKELNTLAEILKIGGFKVKPFLEDVFDPYVFVYSNAETPFGGIRLYKIGDTMAYRAQNEETTHPYGKSVELSIEKIFEDYLEEDESGEKLGEMITKAIKEDIGLFFKKNAEIYAPMASFGQPPPNSIQLSTPPVSSADSFRSNGTWT